MDISWPVRFDHRFIHKNLESLFGGDVEHRLSEYNKVNSVFLRLGGSWERIAHGSPSDIHVLKKVLKFAVKNGHITKKQKAGV